jgi:hypothetical protein
MDFAKISNYTIEIYFVLFYFGQRLYLLSRAKNSGRQCHFKVWLDGHTFKKNPCVIMPMSTKCQENEKKMTTNVIEHDSSTVWNKMIYI